jgi:hypothetical protein
MCCSSEFLLLLHCYAHAASVMLSTTWNNGWWKTAAAD